MKKTEEQIKKLEKRVATIEKVLSRFDAGWNVIEG
jgi:hypothetical protein